jgi:RNA polymerase sigma-70 factor (ECF subfamily)
MNMGKAPDRTEQIQGLIDRLRAGDEDARKELLNTACQRLLKLTRKMLRGFPRVKRWEQTDDVLQNATLRLYRALADVQPQGVVEFFRLAALNIRRELLDLAKHYYGPLGQGANQESLGKEAVSASGSANRLQQPDPATNPRDLAAWTEFHERIAALPDEERETFDLLWYQGLAQAEAARALNVSERTIKRRWQAARLLLHRALRDEPPEG